MTTIKLQLLSPVDAAPIDYDWAPSNKQIFDGLIQTMMLVCDDLPSLKQPLQNNVLNDYDTRNLESIQKVCEKFNRLIKCLIDLERGTTLPVPRMKRQASNRLQRHILQMTYASAVKNPLELNRYEPFSPEVYGETSYDLVTQIMEAVHLTANDVFIDLGSGIGQVVLQVAGVKKCQKSYGIEKEPIPSKYATLMDDNFKKWMNWYGKKFGHYELICGDFRDDQYRKIINQATVILVNNFAFGPLLDHQLKSIFINLKDGTRIVSFKSLRSLNFRLNQRNVHDFGAIVDVTEMLAPECSVSWTSNRVSYFLHEINRSKVQQMAETRKTTISSKRLKPMTEMVSIGVQTDLNNNNNNANNSEALNILIDGFRDLYTKYFERSTDPNYVFLIKQCIQQELELNKSLQLQTAKLQQQIDVLSNSAVELMENRLSELNIHASAGNLFTKSSDLIKYQQELRSMIVKLDSEIARLPKGCNEEKIFQK